MLFIMMTGISPFDAQDVMQIYKNIIRGFAKISFPPEVPSECKSLIMALCQKKPQERLTMGKLGVQNLKDHPWYHGFDWKRLTALKMEAPWKPGITTDEIVAKIEAKPK